MINKEISDLSCNKEEFDKIKSVYESALKDSGQFSSISYNNDNTHRRVARNFWGQGRFLQIRAQILGSSESQN